MQCTTDLVENVIVLLSGERSDHSTLVQTVAVEPGPVQSSVTHLDLNEVTLNSNIVTTD